MLHEYLIFFQGFGKFQSIGGDGSGNGGAGSGGRISMDFADNKTYTGSFDTYGGLGKNNGSPGTSFFYHTGFLLITPSNLTMMQEAKHHLKRCYHPCCNKYSIEHVHNSENSHMENLSDKFLKERIKFLCII
jgi:hypothetical protein